MEDKPKQVYEVWGFGTGRDIFGMRSDDPVEIVHWIRRYPSDQRLFNVHPLGPKFHSHKVVAHNFIALHHLAAAEDLVKKAFRSGNTEGLAKDIFRLAFGR